jgi:c-di-GMP-related signal transduction protein
LNEVFVGRQPILDRTNKIFGYELLFRSNTGPGANVTDNMTATASVMVNTLNNIGINKMIGERKGFVNVDAEMLESDVLDLLPKESTILEILETVNIDERVAENLKKRRNEGFQLALDDFLFNKSYVPIFGVINFVKIDLLAYQGDTLKQVVKRLKRYPLKLLAEKVETREDFAQCLDLGFEFFQGYFFAKPSLITAKSISPAQVVLIELSKLLSREEELFAIENLFKRNPDLNYKLLMFINSASFYTTQKITSIRQSIALLGYRNLLKWVTLLLYSREGEDIKSSPLLERAALRGRIMELLAQRVMESAEVADSAFITGVLSLIDVLLQTPMEQIVTELNLTQEINGALIAREGFLGALISVVEKLEQEQFTEISSILSQYRLTLQDLFLIENNAIIEYENVRDEAV